MPPQHTHAQVTSVSPAAGYFQDERDPPELVGIPTGGEEECLGLAYPSLLGQIADEIPPRYRDQWRLLYSSTYQGRSFPLMLRSITNAGPTVIIIRERGANGAVFGGCTMTQWKTVAERSGASDLVKKPPKQSDQFYGDDRCFVFKQSSLTAQPELFKAKGTINANYMYCYDTHTDDKRIGIGMGGQIGYHAWFLDEWLEYAWCRSRHCTTFSGFEALSDLEKAPIEAIEVYSLDVNALPPERRRDLERKNLVKRYAQDASGTGDDGKPKKSILDGRGAEKALLELAGAHQFRSEDVTREDLCCERGPNRNTVVDG